MGVRTITIYDEDGVGEHNIPNQFYMVTQQDMFKAHALGDNIMNFCAVTPDVKTRMYTNQKLNELVVVATDNMSSRKKVWKQFLKQPQCKYYIEARMGAELGLVYFIKKTRRVGKSPKQADKKFYEATLFSDNDAVQLKCTAKSIIYNVLMISSLICRTVKAIVNSEEMPREQIFDMEHINNHSYMIRN